MEFTLAQLAGLNALLPRRFSLEPHFAGPREDLETKVRIPIKRSTRPKRPVSFFSEEAPVRQTEGVRKFSAVLHKLKRHPDAEFFLDGEPGLLTVEQRLRDGTYKSTSEFLLDLRRVWGHAYKQHGHGTQQHFRTMELSEFSENLCKDWLHLDLCEATDPLLLLQRKLLKLQKAALRPEGPRPKKEPAAKRPRRAWEKHALMAKINRLEPLFYKGLLPIVEGWVTLEDGESVIDLDNLPWQTYREVETYVKHSLQQMEKMRRIRQAQPAEIDTQSSQLVSPTSESPLGSEAEPEFVEQLV